MAARQANSGYELANKPEIKTKDVWWKRRERKQNNDNNKQTLSETELRKRRQEMSACNVSCTRYNPLSSDNTAGQQTLTRLPPTLVHRK